MIIPTKKLRNGFEMPVYGLGTWQMGGKREHDLDNDDEADIKAIQAAIDEGITHIDTAEKYADGYSETLVGKAIQGYDRSKLFLVSKVSDKHLRYDDVLAAAEDSLQRLQTNYLDLYLIHSPDPEVPIQETMKALDVLKERGLIKNIGVSNFTVERFEEAQSFTQNKIVANQLHLNLRYREAERKGLLEYCQKNDVMFIAWRPLQKGILLDAPMLQLLAKKYHKTPAQIALNWLISQDNIVTISKTRDIDHLKENLGALGWAMEAEDINKLSKDFPEQENLSDVFILE